MRTLFVGLRVTDLEESLAFYRALGYLQLGQVALPEGGRLAALSFPGETAVTLELVHRPDVRPVSPGGFDHLAIHVDDLEATLHDLTLRGLRPGSAQYPAGHGGPRRPNEPTPTGTGSSWCNGRRGTTGA